MTVQPTFPFKDHSVQPPALPEAPVPGPAAGRLALQALLRRGNILDALEAIHATMGDTFRMPLRGFSPVFLVGPEANRFVCVTGRDDLRWRNETDPVTRVLNQGLLITDGEFHDSLRRPMLPPLHRGMLPGYVQTMLERTNQVADAWSLDQPLDMLVEMRRLALLILMDCLYRVDLAPQLTSLWPDILRTLAFISPGLWLIWPGAPRRPGYRAALARLDRYLYAIIAARRAAPPTSDEAPDLLGALLHVPEMTDALIRDQLLTILIAGHDTSTAMLAWSFYVLGAHPEVLARVQTEIDDVLAGQAPTYEAVSRLEYLERVNQETLRLYPPIHIGNRRAATDLVYKDWRIPEGTRVVYSIYLTHRIAQYWPEPHRFDPDRFLPETAHQRPHYTFMPFGGGPRNCIGMAFAQVEVKVILATLLQRFNFKLLNKDRIHPHMGATLEPRPGVLVRLSKRSS